MVRTLFLLSILFASPGVAQPEDAEHRADRLRTIELNRMAQRRVDHRDHANADVRDANRKAMEGYQRQRDAWRKRVADCRAGDWSACER